MNSLLASVPPAVSAALAVIAIIGATLVGLVLIRWVKGALRPWLPKPFLGEGSNVEWAELKGAEIAAGGNTDEEHIGDSTLRHDGRASGYETVEEANRLSVVKNGKHSDTSSGESPDIIRENDLLSSWLSKAEHPEDQWARRVLGHQEPRKET